MGKCFRNRKCGVSRKHRVFPKNIVFFVGMTFSSVFEAPGSFMLPFWALRRLRLSEYRDIGDILYGWHVSFCG